ncbi:MAG: PQQ-dependent sugar dehydrogenase [Rubrivivax sp.]
MALKNFAPLRCLLALVAALAGLSGTGVAAEPQAVTVASGLANPWSVAFLPDGRFLVTERAGWLRLVEADGRVGAPLEGLPAIDAGGQCGLLDVVLDPKFADTARIYFSYAEAGEGVERGNGTVVARARLQGNRLADVQVIFRQLPKVSSRNHCGSRLVFARDGRLFVTLGDRFSRKDDAQDLSNHLGKIVRIEADGSVPADNPFVGKPGARAEIWSLGHRNVQGAALHPDSGELWATEHGPQGGDELNRVQAGRNYGWPLVTFGRNYGSGTSIGEEGPKAGFERPLRTWLPTSVAPSGLAFVTGDRYPGWKGHLLMGTLRSQELLRLTLDGTKVISTTPVGGLPTERIRDVRQGPDGFIYVLTDSADGQLLRLVP